MNTHVVTFLSKLAWPAIALGALGLGAGGYLYFTRPQPTETTIVAEPGEFLRQVSVSGKVQAAEDTDLGFTQNGRIAKVFVATGDEVKAGAVLAELDNADAKALLLQKQAALAAEKARLATLRAGTRPEEIAVAEAQVNDAEVALSQARQAITDAVKDAYASADSAIHITVDQFFTNGRSPNPKLSISSSNSQLMLDAEGKRAAAEPMLALWKDDAGSLGASSDLSAAAMRAQARLSEVTALLQVSSALLSQALTSPAVSQSMLDAYALNVSTARTNINGKIAALTAAVTSEKSASTALTTAEKNLALKNAGARDTDIEAQEAAVAVASAAVADASAQLEKTRITAPFSGIVTAVNAKVGKTTSSNSVEVSLIGIDGYEIESYIPEVNIALVTVGDPAVATLDAYGSAPFPVSVASIDPAETVKDGVSTYRAILHFAAKDERIRAGMTANVLITTDKREGVIGIPQGAVAERGGAKFIQVRQGGATLEREVTTGALSSLGTIEIVSGLSEGETVVIPGE